VVSKKAIAQNVGKACRYLAYPGGRTNDLLVALLKKHGFRGAFTQEAGGNPFFADNFKLRRTVIGGQDPEARFRQATATFYTTDLK
jgi:peptidoglycan/xylan/chitin deacetylase (PgdA/CDA1 family)